MKRLLIQYAKECSMNNETDIFEYLTVLRRKIREKASKDKLNLPLRKPILLLAFKTQKPQLFREILFFSLLSHP